MPTLSAPMTELSSPSIKLSLLDDTPGRSTLDQLELEAELTTAVSMKNPKKKKRRPVPSILEPDIVELSNIPIPYEKKKRRKKKKRKRKKESVQQQRKSTDIIPSAAKVDGNLAPNVFPQDQVSLSTEHATKTALLEEEDGRADRKAVQILNNFEQGFELETPRQEGKKAWRAPIPSILQSEVNWHPQDDVDSSATSEKQENDSDSHRAHHFGSRLHTLFQNQSKNGNSQGMRQMPSVLDSQATFLTSEKFKADENSNRQRIPSVLQSGTFFLSQRELEPMARKPRKAKKRTQDLKTSLVSETILLPGGQVHEEKTSKNSFDEHTLA